MVTPSSRANVRDVTRVLPYLIWNVEARPTGGATTRPSPGRGWRNRERVLVAAKRTFEQRGWQGATIHLIAQRAGVSHQMIEATFATKAALLQAVVDFSIRGDASPVRMQLGSRRRHGGRDHSRCDARSPCNTSTVDQRASAAIAWTVEHAAPSDRRVARLWSEMTGNRAYGVSWATRVLLAKPDVDTSARRRHGRDGLLACARLGDVPEPHARARHEP